MWNIMYTSVSICSKMTVENQAATEAIWKLFWVKIIDVHDVHNEVVGGRRVI